MEQYNVTGMSCAACSARVEKAVGAVKGVSSCSVSLLTNSMSVEGTADSAEIIEAVTAAGYGASVKSGSLSAGANKSADSADELKDKETPKMKKRLFWSLGFLVVLMYISMGHMMWGWYLPPFLAENHVSMGLAQMLLTGVIMVINQKFFISGFKGIIHRAPNMDTLVALGSAAAFVYGVYAVFMMSDAQLHGDADKAMTYMHELYFESAGMILTLITLGKLLEAYSKGRTTDALKGLMKLAPKTASVIRGTEGTAQKEETVPIEQVMTGDIFVVRPGESIPVDGIIIDGETAVDESALTGESIPADKIIGDEVNAATINIQGFIKCRASRVGEDTALSRIIRMVSDAAATKAPIAKIADRVSGVFVPTVIALALITAAVWLIAGEGAGFALERGISVLVISCPCALGLATPVAIMVGSGVGAKNGILFKNAASLEETGKTEIVVLDKTGTITKGQPTVTDIIPSAETDEDYLIKTALIKGVPSRLCFDGYCAEVYAVMDAKSIIKLKTAPFTIKKDRTEYSKDEAVKITASLDEFKKVKSKLAKDVYAFTAEIICARLCDFYLSALFAIKDGNADVTEIKEFDLKLKENIVLYLTMEKRFTALDLKKLRACGFKIGFWDYRKIKKLR